KLTPQEMGAPEAISLAADDGLTGTELKASLPGAALLGAVIDPDTGARVDYAMAYGPPCGLLRERRFVEALALPTAHGAAFEAYADDLKFAVMQGSVRLRRNVGLQLTSQNGGSPLAAKRNSTPGFIDFVGWKGAAGEKPLAQIQKLENTTAFRAMRGAVNVMLGRMGDAEMEFNSAAALSDPSIKLWRGLVLLKKEDYAGARDAFISGTSALPLYAPAWRARFQSAAARASLGMDDMPAAQVYLKAALAAGASGEVLDEVKLVQAKVKEMNGDSDSAMALLSDLTKSPREPTAVKAAFEVTRLGVERGKMTPAQAIDSLEALRFRWRGDSIELETIRRLGSLYVSVGRTRDGLGVMRAATLRFPDQPAARRMAQDMSGIFDQLFLHGGADRLDPIVAVGLFYEFKDLTPIGADGDYMIRRLADRLVAFDLLPQAEQLLVHQVDNRLHGLAKAQVATELAAIQLADRRPQDALVTISSSRVARLPDELNRQRRLLQAAALAAVARFENAIELLDLDRSREAERLRADVMWRMADWQGAAASFQKLLPPPGKGDKPLPADQEDMVLRAAIALQFADDQAGLDKLDAQYRTVMDLGARSSAFDMVVTGLDTSGVRLQELAARVAGDGIYDRFLDKFKKRFADDSAAQATARGNAPKASSAATG
ncbi:MAG: hypothetical protein ABWZ40_15055, partial [Caulobacterales bacterium]